MSDIDLFTGNPDFITFLWDNYENYIQKKWNMTRNTMAMSTITLAQEKPETEEYQAAIKTIGTLGISLQVLDSMLEKFKNYTDQDKYEYITVSLLAPFFGTIIRNLQTLDPETYKSIQEAAEKALATPEPEPEKKEFKCIRCNTIFTEFPCPRCGSPSNEIKRETPETIKPRRWTEKEVNYLTREWKGRLHIKGIAETLERTEGAVRSKAYSLDLGKKG